LSNPRLNLVLASLARLVAGGLLRLTVSGAENVPRHGAVVLTMNHLGGADPVLVLGFAPRPVLAAGKAEALRWPVIGWVIRAFGMVPLHRGRPDRAALEALLRGLAAGEAVLIAPEGRESHTGALEAGRGGAAFLAQHANAPIVPVALTGTAWRAILPAWRRLRRPCVTLTFGRPYRLPSDLRRQAATEVVMRHIAALLPAGYHGVYAAARSVDE
jgi:1-acyl-sn-glycerol-3-phosphate acyltransferase